MLRLVKAFWDIAIARRSPAQLPASVFLLCLMAGVVAVLEVLGALLPPTSGRIFTRVALSAGLPLLFAWVVLAIARQRQRFLQTGTALLGVAALAQVVSYPISSLLNFVGNERPASIPLVLLLLVVFAWYLLAGANIWRAALNSGIALGLLVSGIYLLLQMALEQLLLQEP
jgi:hypothetical protein